MIKCAVILFLWFGLSLVSWGQGALAIKPKVRTIPIDGYAARVNDRVITRGEVFETMRAAIAKLRRSYHGSELDKKLEQTYKQTCKEMVNKILILSAFETMGGTVPDQYVQDEVQRIIRTRFKGDAAMFEQSLANQKMTRIDYIERLRDDMTVGIMLNEAVRKRARVTPSEVRVAYEEQREHYFIPEKVKYSVILINKGKTPQETAKKRKEATDIHKKLVGGADFAEMAKKVSEGARAAEGGAFPWMQPKDARSELRDVLHSFAVEKVSDLIETKNEFFILQIHGRRLAHYQSFEKVRDGIKKTLEEKEQARLKKRWLKRLKQKNYVIIFDL